MYLKSFALIVALNPNRPFTTYYINSVIKLEIPSNTVFVVEAVIYIN